MISRKTFICMGGGTLVAAGAAGFGLSDRHNLVRKDLAPAGNNPGPLKQDEIAILQLASLAPSGHNTQPWFVHYLGPYHWLIGNDPAKWLPAVDPTQRETLLSIGAFIQNLEYAAGSFGYTCEWTLLAATCQDERVAEVKLVKKETGTTPYDVAKIQSRRTVRSGFSKDPLRKADLDFLIRPESEFIHHLSATSTEGRWIGAQTVEANRLQANRDPAQRELAEWIRFSSAEAGKHRDGLTTAGMEIEGMSGWLVRNFYGEEQVMGKAFRESGLENVRKQVSEAAGWILISSPDESVASLLETGRRMQRLFLNIREKGIAIHPMTQILEEPSTRREFESSIGMGGKVQFILRAGYVAEYPPPVSLRRPVSWFVRLS